MRTRREFLLDAALTGAAGALGPMAGALAAEPPPETKRIRMLRHPFDDRGFYKEYDLSVQALRDIPYRSWRELDSADSLRFYALRLRESGLVKASPQRLLAASANRTFMDQLKREMKS